MGFAQQQDSSYHGGDCFLALWHLCYSGKIRGFYPFANNDKTVSHPKLLSNSSFPKMKKLPLTQVFPSLTFSLPNCHDAHPSAACIYHSLSKVWDVYSSFLTIPAVFHTSLYQLSQKTTPFQTPQHPKVPSVPSCPTEQQHICFHRIPTPTQLVHFSLETESKIKIRHLTPQSKPGLLFLSFLEEERIELADQSVFENISLWTSVRSIKLLHLLQKYKFQSPHHSRIIQHYQSFHTNTYIIHLFLAPILDIWTS